MNNKEKTTKRNGIILLLLGTVILFSGLAIWNKAENTYYVTQFAIIVIWCELYGLALLTIGILLLNVKSKRKWLYIVILCALLIIVTPIQKIRKSKTIIEYKAITYNVTETMNEDGKSYQKTVKILGKTIKNKTIESDSLYKKFHVEIDE